MTTNGFETLLAACRAHGITLESRPPGRATAVYVLGRPLDEQLRGLLERADGVALRGASWAMKVFGLDELLQTNRTLRAGHAELAPFTVFAQLGDAPCYLATIPELAADDGAHPVVALDLGGILRVAPVASTVDRALGACARHLDAGIRFPWDGLDLTGDEQLAHLLASGALAPYVRA